MSTTKALLADLETFSSKVGEAPSTTARKAVNDGKLPERLRKGGKVTLETAERLRDYMRVHAPVEPNVSTSSDPSQVQPEFGAAVTRGPQRAA